jgi:hypothetical protein
MTKIHEPAYPVLPAELEEAEFQKVYTPSAAEIRFVFGQFRQAPTRVLILTQLKLLRRLGYMPVISDVPHVRCRARPSRATTDHAANPGTKKFFASSSGFSPSTAQSTHGWPN